MSAPKPSDAASVRERVHAFVEVVPYSACASCGQHSDAPIHHVACPLHGEGTICDHDPNEDYEDVSV